VGNSSEFRGSPFISKRRQVFIQPSQFHIGNNLFAPEFLFFLMDFSQVWYFWKAVFKENPTLCVTKGRDYFLWKHQQLPKLHHPEHAGDIWCISNPDLSILDISPYA